MPQSPDTQYKIVRQTTGKWHLYQNGTLVDVEHDPERSPIDEIFYRATGVAWAEDRTVVRGWVAVPDEGGLEAYVAEIDPTRRA